MRFAVWVLVSVACAAYPSRFYYAKTKKVEKQFDEGSITLPTDMYWFQMPLGAEKYVITLTDLDSAKVFTFNYIQHVITEITAHINGSKFEAKDVPNLSEKDPIDLRVRVYENKVVVYLGMRQVLYAEESSILSKDQQQKIRGSRYKMQRSKRNIVKKVYAEGSHDFIRVSLERTMYILPYIHYFPYAMREADVVHLSGFFPRELIIHLVINDDMEKSAKLNLSVIAGSNSKLMSNFSWWIGSEWLYESSSLMFENSFDIMDLFFMRYDYHLYIWVSSPKWTSTYQFIDIRDVFFHGPITKIRVSGAEGMLQYFRTTRDKNSDYLWRIITHPCYESTLLASFVERIKVYHGEEHPPECKVYPHPDRLYIYSY